MTPTMKFNMMGLFLLFALNIGCKNGARNEATTSNQNDSEAILENNKGQAFIEDDASTPNILQIAIGSPDHSTLVAAVQAAELENALVNAGPLMVFAPTNTAFDALPKGTVEDLLKPENKDVLANILKYHVTPGNYSKEFLKNFKKLGQANDQNVPVEVKGDDVFVGGARIIASVPAGNGIVHIVDKVILPPTQ
ncbi:Uncaracterized surface protein containing fasciclin (FAS1) repeats [Flagellimonas taeanensis]|uniref:Uncaracterized surface protein containing fasciclin (FAS1) repeats n=2 Tax=Flagellimonas taeanensis TaxID=1005926 RepID=A0A1M6UJV7_9FLAO|nr:Uncaracterized surface protein containing fasciclin (FAS1) repeats [Allomuricauda taeanensis]SHK69525.1 Uncaracterized surface protein containing fasciclin (FAS1) repeats [Allomuricauda taeanensis]